MAPRPRLPGRRRWIVLGGAVLLLVTAGAVAAFVATRTPGNVSRPDVEFTATQPAPAPVPARARGRHPMDDGFSWPVYHADPARTGGLPVRMALRPPFVQEWALGGNVLLEFPPVLCGRSLYLLKNNGALYSVSRLTGKPLWKQKLGNLAASSPACGRGSVYAVLLQRDKGTNAGRVVAVDARTGRTRWSHPLPSRAESSPLLLGDRLYFGTEDGTVFALRTSDGAVRWRFKAAGAVKGGLASAGGKLFFGDYGGQIHALRRTDGHQIWSGSSASSAFGLRVGRFYGTPAVAFGRVYLGSLDGFVYSFGMSDGKLAWRHKTGGYVYSSPSVAAIPGAGALVYVGSFDGNVYALDARSGNVRWTHNAGGRVSGGTAVIGDLVFYANLARRQVVALGTSTGKVVWSTPRGGFNPVISDGRRLYVNGYTSLVMFAPPNVARSDQRYLRHGARRASPATTKAARQRALNRRVAARRRAQQRALVRRVTARRAQLHRILELRRLGRKVCFKAGGGVRCRVPRPPVCFKQTRGGQSQTVCRVRKR